MALSPRLELRQAVGPSSRRSCSRRSSFAAVEPELEAYVEGELERNPLLQRDEREGEAEAPAEVERTADISETALDQISEAAAAADIDARSDDLYAEVSPGENLSDRVGETGGEGYQDQAAIDWTRAGRGGGSGRRRGRSGRRHAARQDSGRTSGRPAGRIPRARHRPGAGRWGRRGRLSSPRPRRGRRTARLHGREGRGGAAPAAGLRAHRRLRPRRGGVPQAAAGRAHRCDPAMAALLDNLEPSPSAT